MAGGNPLYSFLAGVVIGGASGNLSGYQAVSRGRGSSSPDVNQEETSDSDSIPEGTSHARMSTLSGSNVLTAIGDAVYTPASETLDFRRVQPGSSNSSTTAEYDGPMI